MNHVNIVSIVDTIHCVSMAHGTARYDSLKETVWKATKDFKYHLLRTADGRIDTIVYDDDFPFNSIIMLK